MAQGQNIALHYFRQKKPNDTVKQKSCGYKRTKLTFLGWFQVSQVQTRFGVSFCTSTRSKISTTSLAEISAFNLRGVPTALTPADGRRPEPCGAPSSTRRRGPTERPQSDDEKRTGNPSTRHRPARERNPANGAGDSGDGPAFAGAALLHGARPATAGGGLGGAAGLSHPTQQLRREPLAPAPEP